MSDLKRMHARLLSMRQAQAHAIAMSFWERNIIDGMPEGNKIIGMELCDPRRPGYDNHLTAWCGEAVGKWHELAGMHRRVMGQMQSWYRAQCLGLYKADAGCNIPHYVLIDGDWITVREWHESQGALRRWVDVRHGCPSGFVPRAGDIPIRLRDKARGVGGHVMLASGVIVEQKEVVGVSTVEGNTTGLMPNGKWREGVVVKSRSLVENVVDYILRPSALDYYLEFEYAAEVPE